MRRAHIADVAELAGVSVATVSRAMRGLSNVSPATRARVEAAAEQLDYSADPRASSLASGHTNMVGLAEPFFDTWYASRAIAGIESALNDAGLDLLLYSVRGSKNAMPELIQRFRRQRVDGLILIDLYVPRSEHDRIRNFDVPIVSIGAPIGEVNTITVDNVAGGRVAMRHLIDLGHRRIGFVGGSQPGELFSPVSGMRADGAREALVTAGMDPATMVTFDGRFTVAGGRAVLHEVLARGEQRPTALVCASDEMAMGVIAEAHALGLDLPKDLSLVGFDDHDLAEVFGITTMRQPVRENGIAAVELLVCQIRRAAGAAPIPVHREVPFQLMARSSATANPVR